jgi:ABC-type transporter Mla MlaB component
MTIHIIGTETCLEGDWTLTEVTRNLYALSLSLQQFEPGNNHYIRINCREIKQVDVSGMQFLSVWLQCVRFRGVEPTLVNVPTRLRHYLKGFDIKQVASTPLHGERL